MTGHSSKSIDQSRSAARDLRPTRVRWHIISLLSMITALTYLDRLNLSIAGKAIQDEFAFSTQTMGWILSAFVLGYALFQVLGGWLGDRYGSRTILTVAILWWSAFTAATAVSACLPLAGWFGLAWSFAIVRFLLGVGEAAAFPNSNRMVACWIGETQRGVANSLFLAGIGAGGVLTPLFIVAIMQRWGWRMSFYLCGLLGVVVALVWHLYATNRPEDHPRVNAQELNLILSSRARDLSAPERRRTPWGLIFSSGSVWGLMLSYFCLGYSAYIFYTWFFIYLVRERGLTVTQGSLAGATPFIAIVVFTPLGGWFSDRAVARLGRHRGRQAAVWTGLVFSAAALWAGGHTPNNTLAILLLALAAGFNLFATASWWAASNDLTRNFSGSLSGLMNMFGNLGGWVSPILTAHIATRISWTAALDTAALVMLASGALWILVNAGDDIEGVGKVS